MTKKDFKKISDWLWEVPKSFRPDMQVPARVYASEKMLEDVFRDRSLGQLVNVATLPGIVNYSLAMPDIHEGYGFPIGGVAAMDMKTGVISPGGVGYDINCIHPSTRVNLGFGTYKPVKDLFSDWYKHHFLCIDKKRREIKNSYASFFLTRKEKENIFILKTKSGFTLKVTGDHPVYLKKKGMVKAQNLKKGDEVVLSPFKGIIYEEPFRKTVISEQVIKKVAKELGITDNGNALIQVLSYLKKQKIVPLQFNSSKMQYLLKIIGYLYGDGVLIFNRKFGGYASFYGKKEDLESIRQDIILAGFHPSKVYTRFRRHKINTFYQKYSFVTEENSVHIRSTAFVIVARALGVPIGNKTYQHFSLPIWFPKLRLWQKRLFLAAFFGAEMSKPATLNKYNFYGLQLNINKAIPFKDSGKQFLEDIRKNLKEFAVNTGDVVEVEKNATQGKTTCLRFHVLGNSLNLINFFETVGYEYNKEKKKLATCAILYLRLKQKIIDLRYLVHGLVKKLYKIENIPVNKLVKKFSSQECFIGKRFIEHAAWTNGRENPRIALSFPSFQEFIQRNSFGDYFAIDTIESINREEYHGVVYDLTMKDKDHNFIADNFVVSNCGMRLLKSDHKEEEIKPNLEKLATEIQKEVPSGLGQGRQIKLDASSINRILENGAQRVVEQGYGEKEDLENCESNGKLSQADASLVSDHAKNRGRDQVGTLGSGNHFVEIQKVDEVLDEKTAEIFGLFKGQVVIMIHTGSRGLGHQIATDYIRIMMKAMDKYNIRLPDRELAACPINSSEGQKYLSAMAAGANYAWANRQTITHFVRKAWKSVLGEKTSPLILLYDVAHNIAKIEKHEVEGKILELCLHRKGATRAFPPGHPEIPLKYQEIGQPVLIPGSMGTASYVLVGANTGREAFFSTNHGAGRTMSRHEAVRKVSGQNLLKELESKGIIVKCWNLRGIAEEAPIAYKDVDDVVEIVHNAGLSKKVVRLKPLAVIKGE